MGTSVSSSEARPITFKCRGKVVQPPDGVVSLSFAPKPFDAGTFRYAFKGKIVFTAASDGHGSKGGLGAWVGWTKQKDGEYPCVVKKFKSSDAMFAEYWSKDADLLFKAQKLAEQFNSEFGCRLEAHIKFADPLLAEVTKVGCEKQRSGVRAAAIGLHVAVFVGTVAPFAGVGLALGGLGCGLLLPDAKKKCQCQEKERVLIEPYLDGDFKKLNSNNGWLWKSPASDVAQAFSHWTWCKTQGEMLVCDLQGTPDGKGGWLLTDPAAHSKAKNTLGQSDLGPQGADRFFSTHRCNSLCEGLPKKTPEAGEGLSLPVRQGTSFDFETLPASLPAAVRASSMVHRQTGGTCYAHASATMLRAAESRIVGRPLQTHKAMTDSIIEAFGWDGADTDRVLRAVCPPRRLRYKQVDRNEAIKSLRGGRPILFSFRLSDSQWKQFSTFFEEKPLDILTADVFTHDTYTKHGHAVAIVGQDHGVWLIKNSWGGNFADCGRFRMKWDALPTSQTRFFDVFWYNTDLTKAEKEAYERSLASPIPEDGKSLAKRANKQTLISPIPEEDEPLPERKADKQPPVPPIPEEGGPAVMKNANKQPLVPPVPEEAQPLARKRANKQPQGSPTPGEPLAGQKAGGPSSRKSSCGCCARRA